MFAQNQFCGVNYGKTFYCFRPIQVTGQKYRKNITQENIPSSCEFFSLFLSLSPSFSFSLSLLLSLSLSLLLSLSLSLCLSSPPSLSFLLSHFLCISLCAPFFILTSLCLPSMFSKFMCLLKKCLKGVGRLIGKPFITSSKICGLEDVT